LRRLPASTRVRVAREEVAQIRRLTRQANTIETELLSLIKAQRPQLLEGLGCGPLTAAILIGRIAGAERFQTDASFALQTGTAPIKCSSGQRQQHHRRAWRFVLARAGFSGRFLRCKQGVPADDRLPALKPNTASL
jgi:transposase